MAEVAFEMNDEGNTRYEEHDHAMMEWGSAYLLASMRGEPFFKPRPKLKPTCVRLAANNNAPRERDYIIVRQTDINPFKQSWRATFAVLESVGADCEVSLAEMAGISRRRSIVYPRAVALKLLMEWGASYSEIGRRIGKDHSTIIHSVKATFPLTQRDPKLEAVYRKHKRLLKEAIRDGGQSDG